MCFWKKGFVSFGMWFLLIMASALHATEEKDDGPLSFEKSRPFRTVIPEEKEKTPFLQTLMSKDEKKLTAKFSIVRALWNVTITNLFTRQIIGQQLEHIFVKPSYKPTLYHRLLDAYAGSMPRLSQFLIRNTCTAALFTYAGDHSPLAIGSVFALYGAVMTPFEYATTQRVDSVCQWREGKCSKPLSYAAILKRDFGNRLWKGALMNGAVCGTGWYIFFNLLPHFYKNTDDKDLNPWSILWYSHLCGVSEVLGCAPLYNLQRKLQQNRDPSYNLHRCVKDTWKKGGIQGMYRGAVFIYLSEMLSTIPDLTYMRLLRDRQRALGE